MKVQADLLLQALLAVKHAVADDAGRPILTCILMEPAGPDAIYLAAADNYRVARARVPAEEPIEGRHPIHPDSLPLLLAVLKPMRKLTTTVTLDRGRLLVTGVGTSIEVALMDGEYPRVELVGAKVEQAPLTVVVNPAYLRQIGKLPGEEVPSASIYVKDPLSPVHVRIGDNYDEWIMPVRRSDWKPAEDRRSTLLYLDQRTEAGEELRLAQGFVFEDGAVAVRFLTESRATALYASLADLERHALLSAARVTVAGRVPVKPEEMPRVVCLCGSTRFAAHMNEEAEKLTLSGAIVVRPEVVTYSRERDQQFVAPEVKEALDLLHLRKIDLADEVVVVTVDGYVGESTTREIEYARRTGKLVSFAEYGTADHEHRRERWDIEEDGRRRAVIVCTAHPVPEVLEVLEPAETPA